MEKPPKTWGPGKEFFWHKNSPPVRRNRLSLRKDLRFEKTAVVNDFAVVNDATTTWWSLFLGKCHEIPDAQKWMTSWWLKHLIFEQSISSNWKQVPQEQYEKSLRKHYYLDDDLKV